jgi:hypothetical protein
MGLQQTVARSSRHARHRRPISQPVDRDARDADAPGRAQGQVFSWPPGCRSSSLIECRRSSPGSLCLRPSLPSRPTRLPTSKQIRRSASADHLPQGAPSGRRLLLEPGLVSEPSGEARMRPCRSPWGRGSRSPSLALQRSGTEPSGVARQATYVAALRAVLAHAEEPVLFQNSCNGTSSETSTQRRTT